MQSHRQLTPAEQAEIARIDDIRRSVFFRMPDRPDSKFAQPVRRGRRPIEVIRAQGRARTAAWRRANDEKKRATLEQIGLSLVVALARADPSRLTEAESALIADHLVDLHSRGFSVNEAKKTLARLRKNIRGGSGDDGAGAR